MTESEKHDDLYQLATLLAAVLAKRWMQQQRKRQGDELRQDGPKPPVLPTD